MSAGFPRADLDALRSARTVTIETSRSPAGRTRRTVIWLVVDPDDRVLVRSVRGERGRWYRDLLAHPSGAVVAGQLRVPARAELAGDADRVAACTRALELKYASAGASLASMLVPEVVAATLELHPV
jgi:hypothetical protein